MEPHKLNKEPHKLTKDEIAFVNSLSYEERLLHNLAVERLGSSYFVWKSHAYQEYKARQVKDAASSKTTL